MTEQDIAQKAKEKYLYQQDQDIEDLASWKDVTDLQRDAYIAGWKACTEQEEWKNLYSEGLEVGMSMLRQYKEAMQKVHDEMAAEIAQLKQK